MKKTYLFSLVDIWVFIAFCAVGLLAYSFDGFITYDGYYYYELSSAFGRLSFSDWDFARTPIFPLMLYLSDKFNLTSLPNFVYLNSALIFISLSLLVELSLRSQINIKRPIIIIAGALLPSIIVYQHGLLSEASLIFITTLIFWISATEWRSVSKKYALLLVVMVAAYYIKPHFKYYAVGVFLLNFFLFDFDRFKSAGVGRVKYVRWPLVATLAFFIAIQPWEKALKQSGRMAALNFFPLMMGVVPVDEKYLGPKHAEYAAMINSDAGIPREGFEHSRIYPFVGATNEMLLWPAFKYETEKYLIAVLKSLSVYVYSTPGTSETNNFYTAINAVDKTIGRVKLYHFDGKPELANDVYNAYSFIYQKNNGQLIYSHFYELLRYAESLLTIFSLIMLAYAVRTRDKIMILGLTMAWAYMLMHALALLAIDRYAAPIKLILLYCFAIFPLRVFWSTVVADVHGCKRKILGGRGGYE